MFSFLSVVNNSDTNELRVLLLSTPGIISSKMIIFFNINLQYFYKL